MLVVEADIVALAMVDGLLVTPDQSTDAVILELADTVALEDVTAELEIVALVEVIALADIVADAMLVGLL